MKYTEEDTFNVLRRSNISQVEIDICKYFNIKPVPNDWRDTIELTNLTQKEWIDLVNIVESHYWTIGSYISNSQITYPEYKQYEY